MSRGGVNPDTAERCLGHAIRGIRGVYDRFMMPRAASSAEHVLTRSRQRLLRRCSGEAAAVKKS
jgi:hypothetical protein